MLRIHSENVRHGSCSHGTYSLVNSPLWIFGKCSYTLSLSPLMAETNGLSSLGYPSCKSLFWSRAKNWKSASINHTPERSNSPLAEVACYHEKALDWEYRLGSYSTLPWTSCGYSLFTSLELGFFMCKMMRLVQVCTKSMYQRTKNPGLLSARKAPLQIRKTVLLPQGNLLLSKGTFL